MAVKPHVRRRSIWEYVEFAVPELLHFVCPGEDVDSVPGLIEVRYVPALVVFAVHDVRSHEDAEKCAEVYATSIRLLNEKLNMLITAGRLSVYERGSLTRVLSMHQTVDKGSYLLRFDDVAEWCRTEGIEISDSLNYAFSVGDGEKKDRSGSDEGSGGQFGPVTKMKEGTLGTRERNTLLTIIAALCMEAKLDYRKPAKTAVLIRNMAQRLNVDIGETTIEGHLKKIPDALEARMK